MALVFKLIKIFRTHKIYIFTVLILLLCVEHLTWRNSRQITSRIYGNSNFTNTHYRLYVTVERKKTKRDLQSVGTKLVRCINICY